MRDHDTRLRRAYYLDLLRETIALKWDRDSARIRLTLDAFLRDLPCSETVH